jgi:hypothetical protein
MPRFARTGLVINGRKWADRTIVDGRERTKTRWVRSNPGTGILNRRQRLLAWLGFLTTALMAPVAAHLVDDASWLFSLCVSGLVAAVIVIDDQSRRTATDARGE